MLSVNRRNCYVIQRISVGLKIVKRCSIHRTRLIEYNRVRLRVRVPKLMHNGKKIDV